MRFAFWGDEAGTFEIISESWHGFWRWFVEGEPHPPLYFALLKIWAIIFGKSEIALRMPTVLFYPLVVYLTWLLSRKIGLSQTGRLFAVGIVALHPSLWIHFRMARYYSMTTFLFLYNTILLFEVMEKGKWRWVVYGICLALLFWTNFPAYIVVPLHFFIIILRDRKRVGMWVVCNALALISAALPLLFLIKTTISYGEDAMPSIISLLMSLLYGVYSFLIGEARYPWQVATAIGLIAAIFLAIRGMVMRPKDSLVLFVGPVIVSLSIISLVFQKLGFIYINARLSFLFPMVAIGMAFGTERLRKGFLMIIMVMIGVGYIWGISGVITGKDYHNAVYVMPWKEIVNETKLLGVEAGICRDWGAIHYIKQKMDGYLMRDYMYRDLPDGKIAFISRSGAFKMLGWNENVYKELETGRGKPVAKLEYIKENPIVLCLKKQFLKYDFPDYITTVYIFPEIEVNNVSRVSR